MPSNVKTYDGSEDPEVHLNLFQAATKVERWAMPTWCHMFNSTLTGFVRVWFDDLPLESVDSYDDLRNAFLANFLQQKKCIKDPVEIHHIKPSRKVVARNQGTKKGGEKDQPKAAKKGEAFEKEKALAILMVQPWQRGARQRVTQSFSPDLEISFPPLGDEDGMEGPMIIEAKIEGHFIHRIYVDGGRILDIFAWKPTDMTGVPRHITEHRLNIHEGCTPFRQKKRSQAPERNKTIQEEVKKLVEAGIMKEVHYYSWLANSVMVKKHENSWRMCVDFKDMNKACPKDGSRDAYKGYHQIKIAKEDEEKISFITSQGIFCYSKITFGLKNVGKTYQRLVDKAFQKKIGRNLELHVDDLVIKSCTKQEIIRDIEETFKTLRKLNMKLNPKKFTFGVEEGMFPGYMVNIKDIKVCLDKVEAVLSLPSPTCLKDMQRLNGKLASLNRFLSKSAEKSLPFFKTLKKCTKKSDFQWITEAKSAFKQMNKLIVELPTLTAPTKKEELIVYLAAEREAVSPVLMTKRESKQMPIYFVSRALQDFIVERSEEDSLAAPIEVEEELLDPWTLFTDGSSCVDGSRAGLILTNPKGTKFTYALRFEFEATNNEAEYEALIAEELEKSINEAEVSHEGRRKYLDDSNLCIPHGRNTPFGKEEGKGGTAQIKMVLGDLVHLSNDASHAEDGGKLSPKWEGPFEVMEAPGKAAYKLKDYNGKLLS
nr:reverse transcriptase domain-containing protein [Tanacetum cinerariifolium]